MGDANGFPASPTHVKFINEDRSDGLLVSESPFPYEDDSTVEEIELGFITPWTSPQFPGWQRLFDGDLGMWILIKDRRIYCITEISGHHSIIRWHHLLKDADKLREKYPSLPYNLTMIKSPNELPKEVAWDPYYVDRWFSPLG